MTALDEKISHELMANGYELIRGEYIRRTSLLLSAEVENFVQNDVVHSFREIGYEINRVQEGHSRTVDYEYDELGIEVTALHDYLPQNTDTNSLLSRFVESNSRICAYMFLDGKHQRIKILNEKQMANNISMLCLRQHVSCYRPKILRKIIDKYSQDEEHMCTIIVMDFRLAHFDSLSLKREIKKIFGEFGAEFSSLGGVLISVPKRPDSEMFDRPQHVFVRNEHCTVQHEIPKKLDGLSLTTTDKWITVNPIFIRYSGLSSVKSPCMDCPDKDWLDRIGLPTF